VKFDTTSKIIIYATLFKIKRLKYAYRDRVESLELHIDMEQKKRHLVKHAVRLKMRKDYIACKQRFIESLDEHSRIKRPPLSIGNKQSLVSCIARLESLKDSVRGRFVHQAPDTVRDLNGERYMQLSKVVYKLLRNKLKAYRTSRIFRRCERNCARSCAKCVAKAWRSQDKHCV